jgi:hypothetical protein
MQYLTMRARAWSMLIVGVMYKMSHGPFAIPPRRTKTSTTKRCLEVARSFVSSIRATRRWGYGHKRLLRTTADKKNAKHIRAHDGLKLAQTSILSIVSAWPRDEGEPHAFGTNPLAKLVGQVTMIVRELTTTRVDPLVGMLKHV